MSSLPPDSEALAQQKLFKRLQRLPDALLLARMRALGFWPATEGVPPDPPAEAIERSQLEARLAQLEHSAISQGDLERALREERKLRWEASKARRAARKEETARRRAERAAAWKQHAQATAVHLGRGVSAGLESTADQDVTRLTAQGLPLLPDVPALAAALGIPLGRLRWLSFHREAATLVHYHRFELPKKSGGIRAISAPKPALAACQRWILDQLLAPVPIHAAAHGFAPGHSTLSNARVHVGQAVVVNLDLRDFFPSIRFARVRGIFAALGYGRAVATVLALLCTEPPRVTAGMAGDPRQQRFHVAIGDRALPQGACTSPALTNLLCRTLDRRLSGLAAHYGFHYSRYADDLSFSGPHPDAVGKLLGAVRHVLCKANLEEHPDKTRVMRRSQRQEVTGLVVNQGPALPREVRKRLRAILHNAARHGLAAQNRDGRADFAAWLKGWVSYAAMAEPERAADWWTAWQAAQR